jgi:hypothetical protein
MNAYPAEFSRLDAPAVPPVTQVVYKHRSWIQLTQDEGKPETLIYQPQGLAQRAAAQISQKILCKMGCVTH